jgi:hypothetical protein
VSPASESTGISIEIGIEIGIGIVSFQRRNRKYFLPVYSPT